MGLAFFDKEGKWQDIQADDDYPEDLSGLVGPIREDLAVKYARPGRKYRISLDLQPNPKGEGGVIETKIIEGIETAEGLKVKKETTQRIHLSAGEDISIFGRSFTGS